MATIDRIQNPQTWVRIRRTELHSLANMIGNYALKHQAERPADGDGRPVKEITERISRRASAAHISGDLDKAFWEIREAANDLRLILESEYFQKAFSTHIVRNTRQGSKLLPQMVRDVVTEIDGYIDTYYATRPPPPSPAEQIAGIVPDQKIGPARFEVVNEVLRVQHQAAAARSADVQNTDAAREELLSASRDVLGFLHGANYDPRLTATIQDMLDRIKARQDVIQLGIAAIAYQLVCDQFEEELPSVWGARLRGLSMGVGMYVSQFPDWVRFSENAAHVDFSTDDVESLHASGVELVDELRKVGGSVDPEVPRTLAFLLEIIRNPRRATKRTVFAAIRSIENLIVVVARSCAGILGASIEGTKEGVKVAFKIGVSTTLLALIANTAIKIAPTSSRILQSKWVGKVGHIIKDGLEKMDE